MSLTPSLFNRKVYRVISTTQCSEGPLCEALVVFMDYIKSDKSDGVELAEIRASSMEPSLMELGRYDEKRVRSRFLENFDPSNTYKIVYDSDLVGFFVVVKHPDHHYLDHLYVKPEYQNRGLGKEVILHVVNGALAFGLPTRLGALRGSRSNNFYVKNGFTKTHEDEFDIYYEFQAHN